MTLPLTFEAFFDGLVFRPLEPLDDLAPYTRVQLTVTLPGNPAQPVAAGLPAPEPELEATPATAAGTPTDAFPTQEELGRYIAEHYINSPFYRVGD